MVSASDGWVKISKYCVMIIVSGYIQVIGEAGGGFDAKGNPIEAHETIGEPIPCNFVRNQYQGHGLYEGGEFTSSSYTILIEKQSFSPCRFRLYDTLNAFLGEYEVQRKGIVELQAVGNIQITV